jgi:uncharacterized membrane protein
MAEFGLIVLAALAYPFFAAWLVGVERNRRIEYLEREVAALRDKLNHLPSAPVPAPQAQAAPPVPPGPSILISLPAEPAPRAEGALPPRPEPGPRPAPMPPSEPVPDVPTPPVAPSPIAIAIQGSLLAAKRWLLTGNLVAKLGLVILFIGVAFLLKYMAATFDIPIELRLTGIALAILPLLAWGWRLRSTRREIGLPVQGTAIALMMLVVFGAYQRYGLIPGGLAFAMLVVLTGLACVLALLQDAIWLAVFGIIGGFACPLLVASGQGNHISLFSYYALLNAGVFALATRRSWRMLNLLGFGFTFVVGAVWGGLKYTPANYLSAQVFLILFFLYYVGIALAFTRQQQTRLKDYVDATLVLGTPLLAFGLQVGLVMDKPFGLALSALALGGFYLGLALLLWRLGRERWRVLVETFGAIGAIFGTLAIPLAVDGRWTSATWSLEGVGFVWFGLRRQQVRAWMFGLVLQVGAWIGFLAAASGLDRPAAAASNLWLGFLLLAGGAFVMASDFRRHAQTERPLFAMLATWLLATAAIWLLAGSWTEAFLRADGSLLANLLAASAVSTAMLLYLIGSRLAWPIAHRFGLAAQFAGAVGLAAVAGIEWNWFDMIESHGAKPALGAVLIALSALASSYMTERGRVFDNVKSAHTLLLAWAGFWWFGPVLNILAGRLAIRLPEALDSLYSRWIGVYALAVAASSILFTQLAPRLQWDRLRWLGTACWGMLTLMTLDCLVTLYGIHALPDLTLWLGWGFLWVGSEYLLVRWPAAIWERRPGVLQALHALRTGAPWLALWPEGAILVARWLGGGAPRYGGWAIDSAWSNYLPTWSMMASLVWLMQRGVTGAWPTRPLASWYRTVLIPCGAAFVLVLSACWNLFQDGGMAPLPYLPLLNPLDLSTGFALVLAVGAARLRARDTVESPNLDRKRLIALAGGAYVWFNLILLRSAAHYLEIAYRVDELAGSQVVQAMLSLVWSASALVLMRFAALRTWRRVWSAGAGLLGIVVVKLFFVDLSSHGSMARVVSFVGVGLLMLLVGYLAPFPKRTDQATHVPTPSEPIP